MLIESLVGQSLVGTSDLANRVRRQLQIAKQALSDEMLALTSSFSSDQSSAASVPSVATPEKRALRVRQQDLGLTHGLDDLMRQIQPNPSQIPGQRCVPSAAPSAEAA